MYRFGITLLFLLATIVCQASGKQFTSQPHRGFIENKGQIIDQNNKPNPAVLYLLNMPGMNVQLRRGGFSYDLWMHLTPQPPLPVDYLTPQPPLPVGEGEVSLSWHFPFDDTCTALQRAPLSLGRGAGGEGDLTGGAGGEATLTGGPGGEVQFHRIDFDLDGANHGCEIFTSAPSPGYRNYYTTGTPSEGVTNVRSFQKVTYKNIYPGIDLEFIADEKHGFKYNFVINPGADLAAIRIRIAGPDSITSCGEGLHFETSLGVVDETIPECYYTMNGTKEVVKARFGKIDGNHYGFTIEQKIPQGALLVIDPIPSRKWGTYFGGTGFDTFHHLRFGTDRNIYLCGETNSSSNIATTGAFQTSLKGDWDGMIVSFTANGEINWATYFGGAGQEYLPSLSLDANNNVLVAGETNSANDIASPGAFQPNMAGLLSAYLGKFNTSGMRLWSSYYGGSLAESGTGIFADNSGCVYLCGRGVSPDNIATSGSYQPVPGGGEEGFLAKFTPDGNRIWGTYYGGSCMDQPLYVTGDQAGTIFLAGRTTSPNGISTPGSHQPALGNMPCVTYLQDNFLVKFDSAGVRQWGTYYGGANDEFMNSIAISADATLYICGSTNSQDNMTTPGSFQPNWVGASNLGNLFLGKFDYSGQRLWGTYVGGIYGEGNDSDVAVDDSLNVFISADSHSPDNIATPNSYQSALPPTGYYSYNAMLVKFNPLGERQWGTYYGDTIFSLFRGLATDGDTIYACGHTLDQNRIASPGAYQSTLSGSTDGMIVKFTDCFNPDSAGLITGPDTICPGVPAVFSVTEITYAQSYLWQFPPGAVIVSGQNTSSVTVTFGPGTTDGYAVVRGENACGIGEPDSTWLHFKPSPVPVLSGNNIVCQGTMALYQTDPGKSQYLWDYSPGGILLTGGTPADDFAGIAWSVPGPQWVSIGYTDTNACVPIVPTIYNVNILAQENVNITVSASANNVCEGTPVTFTASPVNGGTTPGYQWKVNANNVSNANNAVFTYTPLSGDLVTCELTSSNTGCIANNPAISNEIMMVINPNLPVGVSVFPSANNVCAGTPVIYTATPVNGGSSPTWQWQVNGTNAVNGNNAVFTYTPVSGDLVSSVLTSSELCTSGNPATSAPVSVAVDPNLPAGISVMASDNPFCAGGTVVFTAAPLNGGFSPIYQWKVNAINVINANNAVFTYSPADGDMVTCELTSSYACATGNPATSNQVTMIAVENLPAGLTISASSNPFCPGSAVTFTADPVNGGAAPFYQWQVNANNVSNANNAVLTYNPMDGDSVSCLMISDLDCVTGSPASSAMIIMSGTLAPIVSFTSCFDTVTTLSAKPFKLKGGLPLGGSYSGPGVNSITGIFTPSLAGTGLKTIQYSYTNAASCSAIAHSSLLIVNSPSFTCGNNLTDIRDNKIYPTVQIGTQCWMQENLDFGFTIDDFTQQTDNCISERYLSLVNSHLSFYQWDELMCYTPTPASQGLCPPGWHIPTSAEWDILLSYFNGPGKAGGFLKDALAADGFHSSQDGFMYLNNAWSFTTGFAAGSMYWTSTTAGTERAVARGMNEFQLSVSRYEGARGNGFSVRCLMD